MEGKANDWDSSSKIGFDFEDRFLEDVSAKKYPLAYKNMKKEEYSYYDILLYNGKLPIVLEEQIKVECKFDEMAYVSKNICIEVGCWGRASGLLVTIADYWVISDDHTVFIIKPSEIRRCLEENKGQIEYKKNHRVTQEPGKYKEMNLYLIPRRIFEPYCCEIGDINNMKYDSLV